jgi:hypothetical protein
MSESEEQSLGSPGPAPGAVPGPPPPGPGRQVRRLLKSRGPNWRPRVLLEAAALAAVVLAIVLLVVSRQTSDSKVTTSVPALPPVTVTPTVTVTPAVAPSVTVTPAFAVTPTVTVTPTLSSSATASVVDTTGTGVASDTLALGLLGGAALFALIGAFYNRITGITGPGGWSITLSPRQKKAAANAASKVTKTHTEAAAASQEQPGAAAATGTQPTESEVTVLTLDYADSLLRAAQTDPPSFLALTAALDIPPEESQFVRENNDIPADLWEPLAERARDRLTHTTPPH